MAQQARGTKQWLSGVPFALPVSSLPRGAPAKPVAPGTGPAPGLPILTRINHRAAQAISDENRIAESQLAHTGRMHFVNVEE
jgi:hypothetical protein